MKFSLPAAIEILERTPEVFNSALSGLSDDWITQNEGPETWSPYDIVGHMIHGELTDWIVRAKIILSELPDKTFEPFDRFAQFKDSEGKSLEDLLYSFQSLRAKNIATLKSWNLRPEELNKTGIHPEFGRITLAQLLAAWVVHDLGHIVQISRVMAWQYTEAVGPWFKYLTILNR